MRLPAPNMLIFVAGLMAGAGINLLTSAAVGETGLGVVIVADSVAWVAAAALLTWAATLLQNAEREAALLDHRDFTSQQRREILQVAADAVAVRVRILLAGGLLATAVAVFLLFRL
ncbi:hypothetical protein ACQPZX_07110 [Actinoplanes sp. CA-142083]|uniref:hypothetical protein n=1 Tax=Actinoplanes sp. CA-142083 TaxID=3239903 RepID=UPI003D8EDBC1